MLKILFFLWDPSLLNFQKVFILYIQGSVCDPNPCANFGVCCPTLEGTYNCKCLLGFEGVRCEFRKLKNNNLSCIS